MHQWRKGMEKMQKHNEVIITNQIHAASLLPQDVDSQRILQLRSQQLAKATYETEEVNIQTESIKYICFNLGQAQEQYGIPYQFVKEVISNIQPTKLPLVPKHIAGIINRRGTLVTVIDLKHFFHTKFPESDNEQYIIIIQAMNITIGIMADDIEGSNIYESNKLDPPFTFLDIIKPELIIGIHQGVTAIINVEALVKTSELQVKK